MKKVTEKRRQYIRIYWNNSWASRIIICVLNYCTNLQNWLKPKFAEVREKENKSPNKFLQVISRFTAHILSSKRLYRFFSQFFNRIHGISRLVEVQISRNRVPECFFTGEASGKRSKTIRTDHTDAIEDRKERHAGRAKDELKKKKKKHKGKN